MFRGEKPNDSTEEKLKDIGKKLQCEAGAFSRSCCIPIASEWTLDTLEYMQLEDFEDSDLTRNIVDYWKWTKMRKKLPKHLGIDCSRILGLTIGPLEERLVARIMQ